jgi:hypothetical protein
MVATRATKQLANFLRTAGNSDVMPVSLPILIRAADLWAAAGAGGLPRLFVAARHRIRDSDYGHVCFYCGVGHIAGVLNVVANGFARSSLLTMSDTQ